MTNRTNHTAQKSVLDKQREIWNIVALMISEYTPWVSPCMITLLGFLPVCTLFFLFITSMIEDITYLLMFPGMIFYLNMDAVSRTLAQITNRSSSFGHMLNRGCDVLADGMVTLMLLYMGTLDNLYYVDDWFQTTIFISVLAIYFIILTSNISEFCSGEIIVGAKPIRTIEVSYFISLLFLSAYSIRNYYFVVLFDLIRYIAIMIRIVSCGTSFYILTIMIGIVLYYFFDYQP